MLDSACVCYNEGWMVQFVKRINKNVIHACYRKEIIINKTVAFLVSICISVYLEYYISKYLVLYSLQFVQLK